MASSRHFIPAFMLLFPVAAEARVFCHANRVHLCSGCDATVLFKVVVSSVPRDRIAGRPHDRPWCHYRMTAGGGSYHPARLIEKPSTGEASVRGQTFFYRSSKVGRDRASVEYQWHHGHTGEVKRGRVTYDIEVVAAPL